MSIRFAALSAVLALLAVSLMPSDAAASEWGLEKWKKAVSQSDWEGFAVGTTYTKRSTTKGSMGGREMNHTVETRETLVKVTPTEFHVKKETKLPTGEWMGSVDKELRKKNVKIETKEAGEGNVTVAGKEYACKRYAGTVTDEDGKNTGTFWVHETHGVLKYEMEIQGNKLTTVVSQLKLEKKIGAHTFTCREWKMSGKMAQMGEMTRTQVMTLDAPFSLLSESGQMGPMTRSSEVIAVTIKKAE